MKKLFRALLCLMIVFCFCLLEISQVSAKSGWVNTYGPWQYYDSNGNPHIGWLKNNGKYYYCFDEGFIVHGGSCWEFRDFMPQSTAGFYKINGKTYAFNRNGAMYTGWFQAVVYELDKHDPNAMQGAYYPYATDDEYGGYNGTRTKKFWFYANSSGAIQTGWKKIGGKWYYFKSAFDWYDDYVTRSDYQKYLTEETEVINLYDNVWGYDWSKYESTVPYTAITKYGSRMYNCNGLMVTGWQKISGKKYYFTSSGAMVTGWQKISKKWYYFTSSGTMKTGWLKLSGKWYYFNSNGVMLANTSKKINGKTYKFDSSGVCTNP